MMAFLFLQKGIRKKLELTTNNNGKKQSSNEFLEDLLTYP